MPMFWGEAKKARTGARSGDPQVPGRALPGQWKTLGCLGAPSSCQEAEPPSIGLKASNQKVHLRKGRVEIMQGSTRPLNTCDQFCFSFAPINLYLRTITRLADTKIACSCFNGLTIRKSERVQEARHRYCMTNGAPGRILRSERSDAT